MLFPFLVNNLYNLDLSEYLFSLAMYISVFKQFFLNFSIRFRFLYLLGSLTCFLFCLFISLLNWELLLSLKAPKSASKVAQ